MGRTNPTFRDILSRMEDEWGDFRRALRRRHQPLFDRLWTYAREHADAAGNLNHPDRLAPVLVSIDIEQEDRIDELERRVSELEAEVSDEESTADRSSEVAATDDE
ncbi:hypothetical protein [Halobaculum rubrum]|uniref:hypothetical protein n=1 Tax=Halobaculum rubrum TaxID=2872158 RepID=UPI001CA3DFF8|nr:hypothetical protein [Halobaculum rubrum]QZX99807.1 hypothetical protein K6T25_01475 [Halobaculum rubrum]QZX99844.1 hypothetical protein K6T25_01670 [Halobaculum rubrum]